MTGPTLVAAGVRWVVSAAGQTFLAGNDLSLEGHIQSGRATIIKHGEHRTVYRVALDQGDVYWKHCRWNGPRAWWRDVLRGPKAKLEYDRAIELARRGVPTIEPLAWGRYNRRWSAGSFLITQALEDTMPLDEFLELHVNDSPTDRRALNNSLAAFISRMHQAGVTHPDLHPGNILIRRGPKDLEFFLIDVHNILIGPPLGSQARQDNLVLLNRWFCMRATRMDRLRFYVAYSGEKKADEPVCSLIELETHFSNVHLWSKRDQRCLRQNRHFRKVRGDAASGFAVRELDTKFAEELAANPDVPFERAGVSVLKDSRSATVCLLEAPTAAGNRVMVYKRFRVPDRTDPIANMFRPSGALRSWKNGHALIDRGIPTPRPYLVLHRRSAGLPTVGYLLCELVADAEHLHEFVVKASVASKRILIDTLARWIRLMHERGISHRDLKAANILVTPSGECHFIDLVGVRIRRAVSEAIRLRDLTRLNASFVASPHVTRTDRLRFLRIYRLWALRSKLDWGTWWKRVEQATQRKIERNAQRNRPLA
jgi:tRNA A-37 threonylcarbamoyl transferase component Bud32